MRTLIFITFFMLTPAKIKIANSKIIRFWLQNSKDTSTTHILRIVRDLSQRNQTNRITTQELTYLKQLKHFSLLKKMILWLQPLHTPYEKLFL